MTIWIAVGILSLICVAALWWGSGPLGQVNAKSAASKNIGLYETRLREIKAEEANGSLDQAEARAQEAEIGRRILASTPAESVDKIRSNSRIAILATLTVPLLALAIYAKQGLPSMPDVPQATRLENAESFGDLPAMIFKVERHLAKNPNDSAGWELLSTNYINFGRFADAAGAIQKIIDLKGSSAELQANLAEALMLRDNGIMPAEAIAAANAALALDSNHNKARYYAALGLAQSGKKDEALALFQKLLADSPNDAPWRASVDREIKSLIDGLARPPQLNEEQLSAGAAQTGEDQQSMIVAMVEGLAKKLVENPNDLTGSLRLIRARVVLRQIDEAKVSLTTARKTFADNAEALAQINALANELNLP